MWQKAGTALPATSLEGKKKSLQIVLCGAFSTYFFFFLDKKHRGRDCDAAWENIEIPLDEMKDGLATDQYWAVESHYLSRLVITYCNHF